MKILAKWMFLLILTVPVSLQPARAADDDADFSQADLDQMLAPIALYPDSVLSHVLIAATYPLEVVEAARWSRRHPDLKGVEAVNAVERQDWDPSVKALTAFPEILARMDENLEWTQELGEAFLAQEEQVMDSVQGLRRRAQAAGNLSSLEHVRVIREREVIIIEPALSHIIYVPYYDPWVIYGHWWWPAYPPFAWAYWGGHPVRYYGSSFYWGHGFHVSPVFYFSGFHWHNRHVVVLPVHRQYSSYRGSSSREIVRHHDAHRWQHDYRHRRGVSYRSERVARDNGHSRPVKESHHRWRHDSPPANDHRNDHRDRRAATRSNADANSLERGADRPRGETQRERNQPPRPERGDDSRRSGHQPAERHRNSENKGNDSRESARHSSGRGGSESRGRSSQSEGRGEQGARSRRDHSR